MDFVGYAGDTPLITNLKGVSFYMYRQCTILQVRIYLKRIIELLPYFSNNDLIKTTQCTAITGTEI